jgi:hypothetical protein
MTIYNRQPDGTYIEMIDDAVISSTSKITRTNKIWFDLNSEKPRLYNPNKSKWGYLKYFMGYINFDNNLDGAWTSYISIPISTAPVESIQYKIEIAGDNINVYSNDGTTVLATGTGGLDFWGKVQIDGKDIRVFDETYGQNYFWIELFDITNQKCIIWTKINAGQTQLNIAYGNSDCLVSNYHNGDMTFEFFDDFKDGIIDTTKWAIISGTWVESNGVLKTTTDDGIIESVNTIPDSYRLSTKFLANGGVKYNGNFIFNWVDSSNYERYTHSQAASYFGIFQSIVGTITENTQFYNFSNNVLYEVYIGKNGSYLEQTVNGTTLSNTFSNILTNCKLRIGNFDWYVQWYPIIMWKFLSTDLSFGTPTINTF